MKTRTERKTEDIDIIKNGSQKISGNTLNGIVNDEVRIDNCMEENKMIDPEANDFLTHIIAHETNKIHPEMNITPDDTRVQEHAKKLEMCLGEMLKNKEK